MGKAFLDSLDTDNDGELNQDEFKAGFARWFNVCDTDNIGKISEAELKAGLYRTLFRTRPRNGFQ